MNIFKRTKYPVVYSEEEINLIEKHIDKHFGKFDNVIHEVVSPDIHIDICIIEPTKEQNYYTLVTVGMGAYDMNVPKECKNLDFSNAELLITLPSNWDIKSNDEKWYWPIRLLKTFARFPLEQKTWLGYGHTVSNVEQYAENTEFNNTLISLPYYFGEEALNCSLSNKKVNFYQLIPLYESELNYKLENGVEELENKFPENFNMIVDIKRKKVV